MKIVCLGDSLTACGGEDGRFSDILQERFPIHTFINRGVGGNTFTDALDRFEEDVIAENPDILIVCLGAVDWWHEERPPQEWAEDLQTIITRAREECSAKTIVLGVFGDYINEDGERQEKVFGFDEQARQYRKLEEEVARRNGCPYHPNIQERIVGRRLCWLDANHPNEYGNRHVADAVEPLLQEMLHQPPLPMRKPTLNTLRDIWDEAVNRAPQKTCAICGKKTLTYAEADLLTDRMAAGLQHRADSRCPKVAVYLPNCLEYFLIYWAVQKLGGVVVPLNTWLKRESLESIFATVCPDLLVVRSPADSAPLSAMRACPPKDVIGLGNLQEVLGNPLGVAEVEIKPENQAIIMHTSGTTASPKGAVMRHSDLLFNVMTTINAHGFNRSDVHLLINPMFHCTALYSSLPTAAYTQTPVVIADRAEPEHLLRLIAQHRITTFLSVPSVFRRLLTLRNLDEFDTSSLRLMAYAGSPMPVDTINKLRESFPDTALHNFFGLTETISMTHVLRNDDLAEHPESIGRLLPFVMARIVDEDGAEVEDGGEGELIFGRENVISGYYNQPAKLDESISTDSEGGEWFHTGDIAMQDEEGFFYIRGRKKEMIIVGGENVYAAEVEETLNAHPQVRDAAVKGVAATGAMAFLGEQIHAWVVAAEDDLTESILRRHCYERLPSYKVPQRIHFVDELPRNAAGKLQKDMLDPDAKN